MKYATQIQVALAWALLILPAQTQESDIAKKKSSQHGKIVGNGECIECHESEIKAWKTTKHFHNKDLHKNKDAAEIARKMGLSSPVLIRTSKLCTQCHFTVQKVGASPAKAISGVSCESCHGGAKDWLDAHNEGDRREDKDTPAAKAKRVTKAKSHGMLYPDMIHKVAANCYSCHIVTDEKLVDVGGHSVGSKSFDLASWAAGEVRHNFFKDSDKNAPTSKNRRRLFYLVGLTLDLEYSMRGLGRAKEKKNYGKSMGRRAVFKRKKVAEVLEKLGEEAPPELKKINELASVKGLMKFNNTEALNVAATAIAEQTKALAEKYDGSTFAALESLIPAEAKGSPYQP